jgi:hypothetical protein
MNKDEIQKQSEAAYGQWCVQWREQAKTHSRFDMKSLEDFRNTGVGKVVVSAANGASLERDMQTIKDNRDNVDILACDKSLGHFINNGIKPDFVILCDANVSYEKFMEPYKDELKDTILFSNVCANPKWTNEPDKWKDIYFFVNEDVLKSELEFSEISGCKNFIPAGTNVSNAMLVFLTQSNNNGKDNFFGYDKILCTGYDYSWESQGNYYAFEPDCPKHNYMRHLYLINHEGNVAYTSNNLMFSARWLEKYCNTFKLPIVQCSKSSILALKYNGKMEQQIKYRFKPEDGPKIREISKTRRLLSKRLKAIDDDLNKYGKEHYFSFIASV